MARGPKPNLDNVKQLPMHDEPQAVHIAKAEALRPADLLTDDELKVWDRIAPHLAMLGRLKPHFLDALCEYCRVVRRLADAREYLDEKDWVYVTSGRNGVQYKSRPEVAQLNDDWRKWRSLVGEFGLAPAAERGMKSGQGDLFDDFDNF
ncbi:P27 family phage terminase small subunit [Methylophaga lonarensis]|uniref:P27 family phage terminase small subunit n=1 Tax=Methylophaga lonarensis TaxID=999151 RepID=UPI003D2DC950